MRTEDAKRHIYHTKKPVKAEDVRKIITAIKKAGKITKDRTGDGFVFHIWKGRRPLPVLPEDSRLKFLGEDQGELKCGLVLSVRFSPAETRKTPTWVALSQAIDLSVLAESNYLSVSVEKLPRHKQVSGIDISVHLATNPKKVQIVISEKAGASLQTKRDLMVGLLAAGSWPVELEPKGEGFTPRNTTGAPIDWDAANNCLTFHMPGMTAQEAASSVAQMVRKSEHSFELFCGLTAPVQALKSWKAFNGYLRKLEKAATPEMQFNLLSLSWQPNGYESFEAMTGMLEAFPDDDQFMSRMFEFEFAGQLGFMELACEAKGFRPWFSFDVETPFPELQKAIGYPLMEMQ